MCSWGPTHEQYVVASIAAGKPVFCEKPLATTTDACRRIMDAEAATGQRLVQVGFMRRYDAPYRALKKAIDSGAVGAPLIYYSGHRNPSVPEHYTKDMAIVDTAVHDFDVTRWLLGEELASIRVLAAKPNSHGGDLQDPLLMILETDSGVLVNVETSVNIRYGYDIRGEVVGEDGTAALAETGPIVLRSAQQRRCGGSGGLARAVHRRLRRGVPGMDQRGGHRHPPDRPECLGRLRRAGRLRRRRRGPLQR